MTYSSRFTLTQTLYFRSHPLYRFTSIVQDRFPLQTLSSSAWPYVQRTPSIHGLPQHIALFGTSDNKRCRRSKRPLCCVRSVRAASSNKEVLHSGIPRRPRRIASLAWLFHSRSREALSSAQPGSRISNPLSKSIITMLLPS